MKRIFKTLALVCFVGISVTQAQSAFTVNGFNHVESVCTDGKFLYAADIGKELNPTGKDGDGKILKLDMNGKVVDADFSKEKLNAPKGITIADGILFAADVDRLVALDVKSGTKLYEITFADGVSFLNDIAVVDKTTLYISATDKSKIYKVNLSAKTYSELKTDKIIAGTNGLFFDKKSNRLYVNGFGADNKPNGIVGYINLSDNKFTQLASIEGYFDGISLSNTTLYISNWVAFEKKGIVQSVDISTGKVTEFSMREPIAGPADFCVAGKYMVLPEMMMGNIVFVPMP